ncbi:MAG: 3-methylornithyl-N6-L-lysine dehydrogenase PylD [Candidatus Methanomethylophilaceae archaeon]|jgi:pyrrolysine biosynthesis protein PylD|nr:3-methylornithyl-N6-L-lysine dehydrogenase PylD [Methanomethylophilus sp.]MDY0252676.1 3-methylornithyl-N6-L-lysine dehydrogenase PylD [Candidatus Methanomethylophilaceae archaeon]NCA74044.1 3-methylornithyl-N6-L-lysine dehydrogenase PylD [Gammaproteobacteria bacterium]
MTRLTEDMIDEIPSTAAERSEGLRRAIGMDLRALAFRAIDEDPDDFDLSCYSTASIPITAGLGVIGGFSQSVSAILGNMGFRSFVTSKTDIDGIYEALEKGADILFTADDVRYIAYNRRTGIYSDNAFATAAGYAEALDGAAGGLGGKEVLVIGAGLVGTEAVRILTSKGAVVSVTDIIPGKAEKLASEYGASAISSVEDSISSHGYILNASPGLIPGRLIVKGAVISSPGVPFSFDAEGIAKARAIIHDPLDIGTAVMAAECVVSRKKVGRT